MSGADQQTSLRRIAALVSSGAPSSEVFAAISDEIGNTLRPRLVQIFRWEPDGSVTVAGTWGAEPNPFPAGSNWPWEDTSLDVIADELRAGRPVRVEDVADELAGELADAGMSVGIGSAVGAPIMVDGELWGHVSVVMAKGTPLPVGVEERLAEITELVAIAFANSDARDRLMRLADEQAALRRVATLVARGAPPDAVFDAVAQELGRVLAVGASGLVRFEGERARVVAAWGRLRRTVPVGTHLPIGGENVVTTIARTGRPARMDDFQRASSGAIGEQARNVQVSSTAGAPIVVAGRLWGALVASALGEGSLPPDALPRLEQYVELVGMAVANTEARVEVDHLAEEQAALRRVATLVATGAPPAEVFDAVAEEVGGLFAVASSGVIRYEEGEIARLVSGWGDLDGVVTIGARLPIGGENIISRIHREGQAVRMDDYGSVASGAIADRAKRANTETSIGSPIKVAGRLWGCLVASSNEGRVLPADAERRLAQFTELIGTAIANTDARVELGRLVDEQAALRRVATLVAEEAPFAEVFAALGAEMAGVIGPHMQSAILRYGEDDGTATVMAASSREVPGGIVVGDRLRLDGTSVSARVYRERRAVRVDDYGQAVGDVAEHAAKHAITAAVGCPIVVKGRVWGAMVVAHEVPEPFPADTERRVSQFTELMATAIANTEARQQLQRLVDEQAALRRVATLVATAAAPTEVFDAVIVEVAQLLGGAQVLMARVEAADEVTVVASRGPEVPTLTVGTRLPLAGDNATARVLRTGRPARIDFRHEGHGVIADAARREHAVTTIGTPITVEGQLWGVITASWAEHRREPRDAEERLVQFAELLGTAIANADSRDQLEASRARLVTAGDEARRRVVRDLHDGGQQRLVHTIITLKMARAALGPGDEAVGALISEALQHAERGNEELRELAHGILPTALTVGGLDAGIESVVARLDLPVRAEVTSARFPREIEASAYFIIVEALTNVVKHAQAAQAQVTVAEQDGWLRLTVRDDGVGGAAPRGGLLGVGDRVAALGGRLRIDSPPGAGTRLVAELPLPPHGG